MSDLEPSPQPNTQSFASWMTFLTWIVAGGIAIWVFSTLLEKQQNPNQNVESYQTGSVIEVKLKQNKQGHYVATGKINGHAVTFLVDTGATSVSIPAHLANALNVTPEGHGVSSTANGDVNIRFATIEQLQLGDIVLNNIDASLNPGMQDNEVLLGMSVLRQLEFTQRGEWLILRTL